MKKKRAAIQKPKTIASSSQPTLDWRPGVIARIRALIREADPEMVEEVKWRKPSNPAGIPVWYHNGIVCTGETYKGAVKMTFAKGASLADPKGLFNSKLEGNVQRAIDFHEGDKINEPALKALIRAAVALNTSAQKKSAQKTSKSPGASLRSTPATRRTKSRPLPAGKKL